MKVGMAGSSCTDARLSDPKICSIWVAASEMSLLWAKEEWRDVVKKDLMELGIRKNKWYEEATRSRARWRE